MTYEAAATVAAVTLLTAAVALIIALTVWASRVSPPASDTPSPVLPAYDQAVFEQLLAMPHFRRLKDGTLVDFMNGTTVTPCACQQRESVHLVVGFSNRFKVGLLTDEALDHYVSVQVALASLLTAHDPYPRVPKG